MTEETIRSYAEKELDNCIGDLSYYFAEFPEDRENLARVFIETFTDMIECLLEDMNEEE